MKEYLVYWTITIIISGGGQIQNDPYRVVPPIELRETKFEYFNNWADAEKFYSNIEYKNDCCVNVDSVWIVELQRVQGSIPANLTTSEIFICDDCPD